MLVSDIMTKNVITIPSDTAVFEAEQLMVFHRFERLPVVDKGKLSGLVTKDNLLRASPSNATTFSRGELYYLLSKLTVKEIMTKDVVTVPPDTTVEQAAAIAQKNKVGCLPVLQGSKIVGIVTTNDFFYQILNPLLGIGEAGKRIIVRGAGDPEEMYKVLDVVRKSDIELKSFCSFKSMESRENDFVLHLNTENITPLMKQLKDKGFTVEERIHTT
ncbi:MAG: CBS domain-containing protein [Deltaproteobacteria bacterium]|nr:CBS domain-containing protein [Deltaproteobacteria bacterium]